MTVTAQFIYSNLQNRICRPQGFPQRQAHDRIDQQFQDFQNKEWGRDTASVDISFHVLLLPRRPLSFLVFICESYRTFSHPIAMYRQFLTPLKISQRHGRSNTVLQHVCIYLSVWTLNYCMQCPNKRCIYR